MNNKYKAAYTSINFRRLAQGFNLPIGEGVSPIFSGPSTTALSTLLLIRSHYPSSLRTSGTLEPILGEENTKKLLELQAEGTASEELTRATSAAIDSGAFGLPWIFATRVTDTPWGFHRLRLVIEHLGIEIPRRVGRERQFLAGAGCCEHAGLYYLCICGSSLCEAE
ncbi:hypothetical protein RUND412_005121 [Rhizina undulata]